MLFQWQKGHNAIAHFQAATKEGKAEIFVLIS